MEEEMNKLYDLCVKIGVATVKELLEDEEKEKHFAKESEEFKKGYRYALTMLNRIDFVVSERDK